MSRFPQITEQPAPEPEDLAPPMPPPPPRATLGGALRRYPMILLLPAIVLVAAGITLGVRRHPVYTASTQLNVGVNYANSQATPGYAEAAEQLAQSYSRQATSRQVATTVATATGRSVDDVLAHLSSSAVPTSPTFYVNAKATSAATAARLSTSAAQALQRAADAAKRNTGAAAMLTQYRTLQAHANALATTEGTLKGKLKAQQSSAAAAAAVGATPTPTPGPPVTQAKVNQAQLAAQTAQLQAQAQSERYEQALQQTNETNLQILNPAHSASSDRRTYIERYGIVGLVAGLVIGAALAFLFARARARRGAFAG